MEKLIGYNDAIEGLLEFGAVEQLIISTSVTINEFDSVRRKENQELADLASFKAQEGLFDTEVTVVEPLSALDST